MDPQTLVVGRLHDELVAIVALQRSKAIEPQNSLASVIELCGSAVDLVKSSFALDFGTSPTSEWLSGRLSAADIHAAADLVTEWIAAGHEVLSILDPCYPSGLREVFNRPPLLFSRGSLAALEERPSVAIVGTRQASDIGKRKARKLATRLSKEGVVIVSGLAAGIDTAAHEAALDAQGTTIAVMGTGLNTIYPTSNRELAARIVTEGGALTTQFAPEQTPAQWSFPMRNVTMSGLAMATIVVEASETSGARQQARSALEHGRPVFLLRSLVESHEWAHDFTSKGHRGTKALIMDAPDDFMVRMRSDETEPRVSVG